jgi:hypothetical protein
MTKTTKKTPWDEVDERIERAAKETRAKTDPLVVKPPKQRKKLEFNPANVRYGVPFKKDISISERDIEMYANMPYAVLRQLEIYFITGRATSYEQMRLLVASSMRVEVPENLIRYHFSEKMDQLEREKKDFITRLMEATTERLLAAADNPEFEKHQRINDGLTMLLEGIVGDALDGDITLDPTTFLKLVDSHKKLFETDPLAAATVRTDRATKEAAAYGAKTEFETKKKLKTLRDYQQQNDQEEDAQDADKYDQLTDNILENIDGLESPG